MSHTDAKGSPLCQYEVHRDVNWQYLYLKQLSQKPMQKGTQKFSTGDRGSNLLWDTACFNKDYSRNYLFYIFTGFIFSFYKT